jgi:hypothetical protein
MGNSQKSIIVQEIAENFNYFCESCELRPATGINLKDGSHICEDCCPQQIAQAWDKERGYPWPYPLRPCFACAGVAVDRDADFAFCRGCSDVLMN